MEIQCNGKLNGIKCACRLNKTIITSVPPPITIIRCFTQKRTTTQYTVLSPPPSQLLLLLHCVRTPCSIRNENVVTAKPLEAAAAPATPAVPRSSVRPSVPITNSQLLIFWSRFGFITACQLATCGSMVCALNGQKMTTAIEMGWGGEGERVTEVWPSILWETSESRWDDDDDDDDDCVHCSPVGPAVKTEVTSHAGGGGKDNDSQTERRPSSSTSSPISQ